MIATAIQPSSRVRARSSKQPRAAWRALLSRTAAAYALLTAFPPGLAYLPAMICVGAAQVSCAGEPAAPDEEDDADAPRELPGLVARYASKDGRAFTRIDAGLRLARGALSVDPRLAPGEFTAQWTGKLLIIAPGAHVLHLYAAGGEVRLALDGKVLVERTVAGPQWLASPALELDYGSHALEVTFRGTGDAAQLGMYWSGPRFELEPIPQRYFFHDPLPELLAQFDEGRLLVRGLRCAACHELPDAQPVPPAPSLARLSGNISRAWLMNWIGGARAEHAAQPAEPARAPDPLPAADDPRRAATTNQPLDDVKFRMPGLGLSREDASHIIAFLADDLTDPPRDQLVAAGPAGDAAAGAELFFSLGCLACHSADGLGSTQLVGGGDLTKVGDKRPADYFARWLAEPAACNPTHRMPVFPLSAEERDDLAAFLASRRDAQPQDNAPRAPQGEIAGDARRGQELIATHRCAACHQLPGKNLAPATEAVSARRLSAASRWEGSCLGEPEVARARPGYRLRPAQRAAVIAYIRGLSQAESAAAAARRAGGAEPSGAARVEDGARLMHDRNCLGCHSRGLAPGIAERLPEIARAHPDLAALLPAMAPPALADIGDKLHREAILAAVTTATPPRRPWLKIRMPRFVFGPGEAAALADYLIAADRMPAHAVAKENSLDANSLFVAGRRLVTSEGFGCASCHQIGKSLPRQDNPAALGADLSGTGARIRREWFDRWVHNPARIVPRMEMPAIEIPVAGVLDDSLPNQVAAVWHVLNQPGFTPPEPGAVRVVRTRNMPGAVERAVLLTDVLRVDGRALARPLLIGLGNRHTVLFDLEQNRLAGWWIGDAARERTEGKRWFWEPGGTHLLPTRPGESELLLIRGGEQAKPRAVGQWAATLDSWRHVLGGISCDYRLSFGAEGDEAGNIAHVTQIVTQPAGEAAARGGFRRRIEVRGLTADDAIVWRLLPEQADGALVEERFTTSAGAVGSISVRIIEPAGAKIVGDARGPSVRLAARAGAPIVCEAEYTSEAQADRYPQPPVVPTARPAARLACVPGWEAVRLPLPGSEMPTGFAWRADGTLLFSSLKGQVWRALDSDGDALPDTMQPLSDELAAPYGVFDRGSSIDVINKNGLLRLSDFAPDGQAQRTEIVADGWGHTDDYHDWAVGLVSDDAQGYYVALPCRQNERSEAAARLRGWVVHLKSRAPTTDQPRRYAIEQFCSGLRFPMGLARDRGGNLFATDNQGNFNPFNELNHLVEDSHYGFLNKSEIRAGSQPPRRDPAIEIPHPWTRSVNGICFLNTPEGMQTSTGQGAFGPWEGHLVGCEYDTRRLLRMSLERIGETFQGAIYPLSSEPAEGQEGFEGPVVCQVGPDGALYVGNLRDSGWGAGQNTGSIVRLRRAPELAAGIAEVRAQSDGFLVRFAQPVEEQGAADPASYNIASFRRIATAEYGGPDVDRQAERVLRATLSADRREARLQLEKLKPGFVYEIRVKNLAAAGALFHPAEAYYTLRSVPARDVP